MEKKELVLNGVIYRFRDLSEHECLIEVAMLGLQLVSNHWSSATAIVPMTQADAIYNNLVKFSIYGKEN